MYPQLYANRMAGGQVTGQSNGQLLACRGIAGHVEFSQAYAIYIFKDCFKANDTFFLVLKTRYNMQALPPSICAPKPGHRQTLDKNVS